MHDRKKSEKILRYSKKLRLINDLGGKCKKCKENSFFKLTFHHIDSNEKDFEYSDNKKMRFSKLKNEIEKCELLCQNCHREFHFYEKNGDKRRNDKIIYLEYAGSKCVKCGYNKCPGVLSFHHRDPNLKEFWMGSLSERINSIQELDDRIKNEIDKCDILCANCHSMEHSDIDFFNNNIDRINDKIYSYREPQSKINRENVKELYLSGKKQVEIAKHFNTSKSTISEIIKSLNLK